MLVVRVNVSSVQLSIVIYLIASTPKQFIPSRSYQIMNLSVHSNSFASPSQFERIWAPKRRGRIWRVIAFFCNNVQAEYPHRSVRISVNMGHHAAAIAAIFLVWLPLGLPQKAFGQCYSGTTPTRCEPTDQTFTLNRQPFVNSTCGTPPAPFCAYQYVLTSGAIQSIGCNYTCNSSDAKNSHPASFLTDFPASSNPTWWQSNNSTTSRYAVSITLNLAALVEVTKITIQFRNLVPMSFYIEKSVDNNRTYSLFNFFQRSCIGQPTTQTLTYATEVTPLCTLLSSPADFLSTVFVPINGRPSALDSTIGYSQSLYDFIQATNIRVTLMENFPIAGQNPSYYYAIQDLAVVGRFQCNGHAASITNMACNCEHNTKGVNCEQCLDLFNDIPWERNDGNNSFACQACNCNQHSTTCAFNSSMYNQTGGISGGICVNCTNNTAGVHCETCAKSFYPLPSKSQSDPNVCASCNCDARGMNDSGDCQKSGPNIGNCFCKVNVAGSTCDTCKEGYFNISADNLDGCQECRCNTTGSLNSSCAQLTGVCNCKSNVIGQKCDYCQPNYYQQSPSDPQGCQPCNCNLGGSLRAQCDIFTGQCPCRNGVTGKNCSTVVPGRYFPLLDYLILEAEFSSGSYQKVLLTNGENTLYTGTGIASVSSGSSSLLNLGVLTPPSGGWYQATFRYSLQGHFAWSSAALEVQGGPEVGIGAPSCTEPNGVLDIQYTQWSVGNNTAISQNLCLRGGRSYHFVLKNVDAGTQEPGRTLNIDSFFLTPININGLAVFNDNRVYTSYNTCVNSLQTLPRPLAVLNACRNTIFQVSTAVFNGTLPCTCNTTGSTSTLCNEYGGQCTCSAHISGLQCGYCTPGYYNFSPTGCQACNCNPSGSSSLICSDADGSCPCVSNVTGQTCSQCSYGYYNLVPGVGCSPCNCNVNGSASLQCQQGTGICTCNPGVVGSKCDHCINGYYGFSNSGCRSCNCSTTGTIGGSCDTTTGVCFCLTGASGRTCDSCLPGYYANSTGYCQACNCDLQNSISQNCTNGMCTCIHGAVGVTCNGCTVGYYKSLAGVCTDCGCNTTGSLSSSCAQLTGVCNCKSNVIGQKCDYCQPNYYQQSPSDPQGCQPCNCNLGGSLRAQCDIFTGQCPCRNGVTGKNCSTVVPGRYFPLPDYLILEAEFSSGSYQKVLLTNGENTLYTGTGIASVSNGSSTLLDLGVLTPPSGGWYQATFRYSLQGHFAWSSAALEVQGGPEVGIGAPSCTEPNGVLDIQYTQWSVGNNTAISQNLCLRGGRSYHFVLKNVDAGTQEPGRTLNIDSFFLTPININGLAVFNDNRVYTSYNTCVNSLQTLPRPLAVLNACRDTIFQVSTAVFNGTLPCTCNTTGSTSTLCNEYGGQCTCSAHISGLQCGYCTPGYYNFSPAGCQACNCNPSGSSNLICSDVDGSCRCVSNVTGQTCSQCSYGYYNLVPGVGCSPCNCNVNGSASLQCQQGTGTCSCNSNVAGDKCDHCFNGYYNLTAGVGCSSCNCSTTGTIGGSCDTSTGVCFCVTGASGQTCDTCLPGYYANSTGYCQACNCDLKNSVSQNCTSGICNCISGAMGVTCDECMLGYYKTQTGVCTVCTSCYSQSAAIIVSTNNTLSLNYNLFNATNLPNQNLAVRFNSTSIAVSSVCLRTNDTAKFFIVVRSALSKLADKVTQFATNVSQTMDVLGLVQYYADVVYVNAIAATTLQNEIEEEVAFAIQCLAETEYSTLPQLQGSKDAICNYVSVGQLLYDKVVNFSLILQNQLNQANSSLSKTQVILDSINVTISQAIALNDYNLNFITKVQKNFTEDQVKLNFVNTSLFTLKNATELLSDTISKFVSIPIILPLKDDLISLWNHANVTISFVKDLISQVDSDSTQAMDIRSELTQLQAHFDTLSNKLLQLTTTLILNSNITSSLKLALVAQSTSINGVITDAVTISSNLQTFNTIFSQTVSLLNQLLNNLHDLQMVVDYCVQRIVTITSIISNFNEAAGTVNDTAAVIRIVNEKVTSINSSLPRLMLSLVQDLGSSNLLVEEVDQTNATVQMILSKSQMIKIEISNLETLHEQGRIVTNLSNQSLNSVMSHWNMVKAQLQQFYNQSSNLLYQISSTKMLCDVVKQQANSTTTLHLQLSSTLGTQQSRKLQLEANIKAVQSSVQYLRQLRNTITAKCTN